MSDRPLFATSMRGFGVYLHGYKTKHYKEDVRKYLFWINSLGGSVLRRVDSNKPKVHIRHGQSYFGTLNALTPFVNGTFI